MKKFLSAVLALTLLFCTACGAEQPDNTDDAPALTPSANIFAEITDLDLDSTVVTVDGNEISANIYLYWVTTVASNMEYQVQMYNTYYGLYGDVLNSDMTLKWDASFREDQTVEDYVRAQVTDTVLLFAAVENMAKEYGIKLSEENLAAIEANKATAKQELGGEEAFAEYLSTLGISEDLFDRLSATSYYFDSLTEMVLTEGSPLYLENEDYNEYGYYADHILLATMDTSTYTSYGEEVIAEKRALAESILAQLQASDDMETLFAQLADEYSEDPGRETNPTGYIFTPGTMVEQFEQATEALKPGELSGIVESNYGFHIILRRDLAEGLKANPDQRNEMAAEHLDSVIKLTIDNADVVTSDAVANFNIGEFYTNYMKTAQDRTNASITDGNDDTTLDNSSSSSAQ